MAQRPVRLLGLPETRSLLFLITNSPDQAEGYLDYLQPLHGRTYNSSHRWLAVADLHITPVITIDMQQNGWKIQRCFAFGGIYWKVGDKEILMVAVDHLKTLIQLLTSLGNDVTEASKIERIKDGLKSAKYKLLFVSMAMQPLNTTFDQFVSMIKNFDKATQYEANWGVGESSLGEIHLLSPSQKKFLRNKKDIPDDRQEFYGVF
jgi:hypothetical protein